MTIECRGLELVDFAPREGWKAKGAESGTVFEDIDLTDGDYADYDEKVREATKKPHRKLSLHAFSGGCSLLTCISLDLQ